MKTFCRDNLLGRRFGMLLVIQFELKKNSHTRWLCVCDCGQTASKWSSNLKVGRSTCCGCLYPRNGRNPNGSVEAKGKQRNPYEGTYRKMISRCYDVDNPSFRWYGEKGIGVCCRWLKGEHGLTGIRCFANDMGPRPSPQHSIDRIDSSKDYAPGNCKWSTPLEQTLNRSSTRYVEFEGERIALGYLVKRFGLPYVLVYNRIFNMGWSLERALTTPNTRRDKRGAGYTTRPAHTR